MILAECWMQCSPNSELTCRSPGCDLRRAALRLRRSHSLRRVRKSYAKIYDIPVEFTHGGYPCVSAARSYVTGFPANPTCKDGSWTGFGQHHTASGVRASPAASFSSLHGLSWTPAVANEWELRQWPPEN